MRKILLSLVIGVMLLGSGMCAMPIYATEGAQIAATNVCDDDAIDAELKKAAGCEDFAKKADKTAVPIALNIINIVLTFVGLLAVGVIVYGGILYATSVGDASKIAKAKNCILYGVIGLVVAMLSFAIVAFINTSILKK